MRSRSHQLLVPSSEVLLHYFLYSYLCQYTTCIVGTTEFKPTQHFSSSTSISNRTRQLGCNKSQAVCNYQQHPRTIEVTTLGRNERMKGKHSKVQFSHKLYGRMLCLISTFAIGLWHQGIGAQLIVYPG